MNIKTTQKQGLFWDVNLQELDEKKHSDFIIQRILEKGDLDDLQWAIDSYGRDSVKNVFGKNSAKMDRKSQNFWCLYFNIDKAQCIQKPSMPRPGLFWKR
jgi:hypothetical protein